MLLKRTFDILEAALHPKKVMLLVIMHFHEGVNEGVIGLRAARKF